MCACAHARHEYSGKFQPTPPRTCPAQRLVVAIHEEHDIRKGQLVAGNGLGEFICRILHLEE